MRDKEGLDEGYCLWSVRLELGRDGLASLPLGNLFGVKRNVRHDDVLDVRCEKIRLG